MALNKQLKIMTNKTYGGWNYTYDGAFPEPRVKGKDKKMRTKYQRTLEKRISQKEINKSQTDSNNKTTG